MKRVTIAGTDLESSPVGLGGANLGGGISEADSFRLLDRYAGLGGNLVDTAQVYANWLPIEESISEITIGKWMKARNNRNQLIVTTKGAHPRLTSMNVSRMAPEDIAEDVEGSLRRLGVDTIDLYWLHRDDASRPVADILESLNRHVARGHIRYFGCSNWTPARIAEAQRTARENGLQGFVGNQMRWSLAHAEQSRIGDQTTLGMDDETMRLHRETGLTAIPYSSQAQGLFTKWAEGVYKDGDDERIPAEYRLPDNWLRFQRANRLAGELGVSINRIVLAYLQAQPFPTIPIAGCRTEAQIEDSMGSADIELNAEQAAYLERG